MAGKNTRQGARLRREVAAEAARILATEGQRSYRAAKEKAAQRKGLSPRVSLPSNAEIEAALKSWQQLYGGDSHAQSLRALRRVAVSAMKFFSRFRPKLVGPVLEGTADRHSRISLHLFSDEPDEVPRFLLEQGLPFTQESRRIRWHDGSFRDLEIVVVEAGGDTVELILMVGAGARQAPPSPIDGKSQRRAGIAEVERLLDL